MSIVNKIKDFLNKNRDQVEKVAEKAKKAADSNKDGKLDTADLKAAKDKVSKAATAAKKKVTKK